MGELKTFPAGPVAASAISFGATHLALRHGPVQRRLTAMYARRKDAGLLQPNANPPELAAQAGSRILNELHNFMVVPLAVAAMFDKRLNNDRVGGTTPLCSFLTTLTAGYFFAETIIISKNFQEHGIEPFIHGAVCVVFFLMVSYTKKMQWFVPRTLFFECSTPLVHLRWFLASLGMADTKAYKVNGLCMMAAFFGCRVVWGTSCDLPTTEHTILCLELIWSFLRRTNLYTSAATGLGRPMFRVVLTSALGISFLNYYWFYRMCRGAFKVLRRKRGAPVASRTPSKEQDDKPPNGAS